MKKIVIVFFFTLILFYALAQFSLVQAQGQFAPQPGITCGQAFDPATQGAYKPNDLNQRQYSCCYSPWEDFGIIDKTFAQSIPLVGDLIETAIDYLNKTIYKMPFIFLPDITIKLVPNLGNVREGMRQFMNKNRCVPDATPIGNIGSNNCYCKTNASPALAALKPLCDNIGGSEKSRCYQCIGYNPSNPTQRLEGGVWTAIGCIKTSASQFVTETIMGFGISLAGIIALMCIIYSAFMLQTSGGNPERIKKAQEMLTSCIMGLMLIIFAVFILRVVGVDILRIPGFR